MLGEKTNERPRGAGAGHSKHSRAGSEGHEHGTRAVLRHARIAPNKVREVLNLVRDRPVQEAEDILRFSERDAAFVVNKVLHSAVANAENNDDQDPEELFVSACFADEGTTIKRWRPRARGRATRIRKRTSHITVIVSRLSDQELDRLRARRRAEQLAQRSRRVAGARGSSDDTRSRAERRRRGPAPEELEDLEEVTDEETEAAGESEATDGVADDEAESVDADATDEVDDEAGDDATDAGADETTEEAESADTAEKADTEATTQAETEEDEPTTATEQDEK